MSLGEPLFTVLPLCPRFELRAPEDRGACSWARARETVHIYTERYVLELVRNLVEHGDAREGK